MPISLFFSVCRLSKKLRSIKQETPWPLQDFLALEIDRSILNLIFYTDFVVSLYPMAFIMQIFSGDDFTLSLNTKEPSCLFTFLVLRSGRSPIRLHLSNSGSIRKLKPTSLEEFCHFFPVLLRSSKAFKVVTKVWIF